MVLSSLSQFFNGASVHEGNIIVTDNKQVYIACEHAHKRKPDRIIHVQYIL